MDAYTDFAEVYDIFMDETPYEAWCQFLVQRIETYGISQTGKAKDTLQSERNLVLDLGCGTGKLTELLAARGYDMIGVDSSEGMLAAATKRSQEAGSTTLYLLQDMRELELYSTVGTVISVCDSLNYLLEEEEVINTFRLVNNYLYPGGIFLFDFNTVYKYKTVIGESTIAENREDCSFIWENYYQEENQINEYDLTIFVRENTEEEHFRRFSETHYQRGYTLEQMQRFVESAGMKVEKVWDADTHGEARGESERIYILARECGKEESQFMSDYIVTATAANAQIRAFACTTRDLVEEARQAHNTSPVITAALGRLLTAGSMMGSMMKGEEDILTLQIKGDGPVEGITVTADSKARVKGYANQPAVMLPPNARGKLDVSGAIGQGFLNVIKDLGMKEPYIGKTALQTGEIAEDLTFYFAVSEQTPSSVGLGVLMEKDNTVKQAGGFILQLMPFAEDSVIDKLEQNLVGVDSVTAMLEAGKTPEQILELLLEGMDIEFHDTLPTQYYCNCTKHRVEKAIISIGRTEILEMIDEGKEIEVNCHFCNKNYVFSVEELKDIYQKASQ